MSDQDDDFSFGERLGIFFTVQAAVLSAASVTFILCFAGYKWLRRTVLSSRGRLLRPTDASDSVLFLNLMLADLIQAIGNMPNIRWMADGRVTEGQLCTAQSAIKQVGIVGVAMTSLAIAVHTFSILVLRWKAPKHISKYAAVGVWFFIAIVVGIPTGVHRARGDYYYGKNGYWCWIVPDHVPEMIVTEYLWVWFAGLVMAILYTMMFVVIRGWWSPGADRSSVAETEEEKETKTIATLMLYYPAVYIFCIFPNSLSRWLLFSGQKKPPYQFSLFANTLFALSGTLNLILFFFTRRDVVVGQRIVVEQHDPLLLQPYGGHGHSDPSHPSHRRISSSENGRLPQRNYADDAGSLSEVELDVEKGSEQPDFDPRVLPDHELHQSPVSKFATLPSMTSSGNQQYLSVDPLSFGRPRTSGSSTSYQSDSREKPEDYGRLPSR